MPMSEKNFSLYIQNLIPITEKSYPLLRQKLLYSKKANSIKQNSIGASKHTRTISKHLPNFFNELQPRNRIQTCNIRNINGKNFQDNPTRIKNFSIIANTKHLPKIEENSNEKVETSHRKALSIFSIKKELLVFTKEQEKTLITLVQLLKQLLSLNSKI
jgi:hypothetical protein